MAEEKKPSDLREDPVIDQELARISRLYRTTLKENPAHKAVLLNALTVEASAIATIRGLE